MDCIVHGVAKGRTQLNDFDFTSLVGKIPAKKLQHVGASFLTRD